MRCCVGTGTQLRDPFSYLLGKGGSVLIFPRFTCHKEPACYRTHNRFFDETVTFFLLSLSFFLRLYFLSSLIYLFLVVGLFPKPYRLIGFLQSTVVYTRVCPSVK